MEEKKYWLISANHKIYDHQSSFKRGYIDWRDSGRKYKVNDIVYIYAIRPFSSIQYKCVVEKTKLKFDEITDDSFFWEDKSEYNSSKDKTYIRLRLLKKFDTDKFNLENLGKNGLNAPPQGPMYVNDKLLDYIKKIENNFYPESDLDNQEGNSINDSMYIEGNVEKVYVSKYERNANARKECLKHFGYDCQVCGFNFEDVYGEIGKSYIHVHHIVPLSKINKEYVIDPIRDLIPLCPNCHSMIHINSIEYLTPNQLKSLIRNKSR